MTHTLAGGSFARGPRHPRAGAFRNPTGIPTSSASCSAWCCSRPTPSPAAAWAPPPRSARWTRGSPSIVAPEHAAASAALAKYFNDGSPLLSWTLFLVAGAFVGALISGILGHRMRWTVERGPQVSVERRLLLAFVGGFVAAYGAKIAKGCTSGQALTGGAILNVGSLVFMLAVFASAYGLAWFVRKEWL